MDTLTTYILMVFILSCRGYAEEEEGISCAEHQTSFDEACYEFVGLQFSFLKAQGWCERAGGHLVFILNDEMQQFLQMHLEPDKDWWLGLAPAAQNLTLDPSLTEGSLAWLDGSDVSYNNWVNLPEAQATCGHIQRHTGFQWTATENCTQELNFVCQFDFGRTFACEGQNATLQCSSGQVLEIEDAFYGRKTVHYCQSHLTVLPSVSLEECSWINVLESVTAYCRGLQACQAQLDLTSLMDPCPILGSYLSVEYRCKNGLHILMTKLASVVDNVTINVKWLLHPFHGNLTCIVDAGDGHIIDPYNPEETESSIIHRFRQPGVFVVEVECTTSDWHVTAQKTITVQEPVGKFRAVKCYGSNLTTDGTKCSTLPDGPVQIELNLEKGTSVTYTIHHNGSQIVNSSVDSGITSHNITLNATVLQSLKYGCSNLTVAASNRVTPFSVSTEFLLCLLEPVVGLRASVMTEADACPDSPNLTIGILLEQGAPVRLHFDLTGRSDNLSETRHMLNNSLHTYTFSQPLEGLFKVKVQAMNYLSASQLEVDLMKILQACQNYSSSSQDGYTKEDSNIPDGLVIMASPDRQTDRSQAVELSVTGAESVNSKVLMFKWQCKGNCSCGNVTSGETHIIEKDCLPNAFETLKYTLTVRKRTWFRKWVDIAQASKCITVAPLNEFQDVTISCDNCDSLSVNDNAKLSLSCATTCPDITWFIEDPNPVTGDLDECYSKAGVSPPMEKQYNSTEYTVSSQILKYSRSLQRNINVIAYGEKVPGYAKYHIPIPGPETTEPAEAPSVSRCSIFPHAGTVLDAFEVTCESTSFCSTGCLYCLKTNTGKHLRCSNTNVLKPIFLPLGDEKENHIVSVVVTVKNKQTTWTTTVETLVRKSSSSTSIPFLQSTVENTVDQLEQQGLLSGEALGQIFTSVSDMLNSETGQHQKDTKAKLREQMLSKITAVLQDSSNNTTQEVQATAEAVAGLTQMSDELSPAAQVQ